MQLVDTVILLKEGENCCRRSCKKNILTTRFAGNNKPRNCWIYIMIPGSSNMNRNLASLACSLWSISCTFLSKRQRLDNPIRLHIHSNDVSIVTSPTEIRTSVLNILEAEVMEIGPIDTNGYSVDIKLDVGQPYPCYDHKKIFNEPWHRTGPKGFMPISRQ